MSKISRVIIVFLLLIAIFGCSSEKPSKTRKAISLPSIKEVDRNGEIVFSLGGEASVLNPILSTDTASSAIEGPIFSGMIKFNEKLEPIPDLAKSWEVSKDGKVWTFHLRKDVLWHDGKAFTAEDVKFTFESILDPRVNSVRRSDYIINGEPIRFEAVDKYTLRAFLPKPFAPFLVRSGMSVIPKHILEGKDINTAKFNRKPVGTGPFVFAEWKTGDHATVVRNPKYYGKKPLLKEITFRVIPDENARLVALETGEIDETGIPPKDYSRMISAPNINIFEYDSLVYTYLGFNLASPLFSDKRVRQALAYATNKDQLVSLVLKGFGRSAHAPSSPVSWAYSDNVPKFPYNTKKALDLMKVAGWETGKDGWLYKNDKRFEFTLITNQGNKEREKAAIILQQQYKKIGVKMNIRIMEWSALLKVVNAPTDPKDFDAVIMGWSLGIDPDAYTIWHSSEYPRGFNFVKYNNPVADLLLERGRITMDRAERKKIYGKLWETIAEDQPYIFLWYPKSIHGIRDRVGGLLKDPGPTGPFLYIEDVFVRK